MHHHGIINEAADGKREAKSSIRWMQAVRAAHHGERVRSLRGCRAALCSRQQQPGSGGRGGAP